MLIIIYMFSVSIRSVTDGTDLGQDMFDSVPTTMRFLLLSGTMPDLQDNANQIWESGFEYAIIYLVFALIISITVMNMLVGVLVGVVHTVTEVEQEQLMVEFVRSTILQTLKTLNVDE